MRTLISFCLLLLISMAPARAQDDVLRPAIKSVLDAPADSQTSQNASSFPAAKPVKSAAPLKLETRQAPGEETAISPEEIPPVILEEMAKVERNCNANMMYAAFHDCRCVAVKFVDARIKSNPETSGSDAIFQKVKDECPNEPGIAGFVYTSCADVMKYSRPQDFDKFCKCSANQVARNYTNRPMMNISYIDKLRKRAFIDCGIANNPANNSPYLPQ